MVSLCISFFTSKQILIELFSDGKAKIQLQIVMHDGASTTFHFVNPSGPAVQIKDRDEVKDLLQELLPKFKRKVNKELEEKNRMLRENPGLLQLYKDLVNLCHSFFSLVSIKSFLLKFGSLYNPRIISNDKDN